jgi:CubicO group peptidase (beta-lactamase class C family)
MKPATRFFSRHPQPRYALLTPWLAAILLLTNPAAAGAGDFPGRSWEHHPSPEEAGFSSEKLAAVRQATEEKDTAAVMIIHRGRVVDSWGDLDEKYRCHSLRKSFLSALYGIQVEKGTIDLDATMEDLGIDDNDGLSDTEKQATVRMLIKARSGVYHPALFETRAMAARRPERHSHAPGENYYYNNWDFNALGTIYEQETGEKIHASFEERIADPIGMEDYSADDGRYVTGDASRHAAYPFVMSTRDLARFGLLYLNDGMWDGERVLPESWVAESVTAYSDAGSRGGYGYMWWVAVDGRHFSGVDAVPEGTYTGRGARGHVLAVVPEHDLVFVHRVDTSVSGNRVPYGEIGQLLMDVIESRHDSP